MTTLDGLKFMRGERVLSILNEDSSYRELFHDIERGFPRTTKRQHSTDTVVVTQTEYIAYPSSKALQISAQVRSNGRVYEPTILFLNVEYENEDTQGNVTFMASDGKEYSVLPISLTNTNVKVRCTCLDFYHRFSTWNFKDNSLFGPRMPPYRRKTRNRPPVNPMKVPGLCKHIIKTFGALRHAGLVQ